MGLKDVGIVNPGKAPYDNAMVLSSAGGAVASAGPSSVLPPPLPAYEGAAGVLRAPCGPGPRDK